MNSPPGNIAATRPAEKTESRIHLDFLDGIRGWAALYIMSHHIWMMRYGLTSHRTNWGLITWLLYGHLAVDVFIVLSGFCLAIPASRDGLLRGGALAFYKRRARRILPPFYLALFLVSFAPIIAHGVFHTNDSPPPIRVIAVNALLVQDIFAGNNYIDPPFWSVALEWKIYFLLPLLLAIWRRTGYVGLLTAGAAIGYSLFLAIHLAGKDEALHFICPWYVFLFGLGVATGLLSFRDKRPDLLRISSWAAWGGLALCLFLLWLYPISWNDPKDSFRPHLPIIDPAVGLLTAACLCLLTQQLNAGRKSFLLFLMSWRPIVAVGTFAYSLYLLHYPVIWYLSDILDRVFGPHPPTGLLALLLYMLGAAFTLLLTYGFFLLCERPFLNARQKALKRNLEDTAALEPVP